MSARIPLAAHAALTLAAAGLSAQAGHEHRGHAEALGRVTFPTSCRAEAQRRFERGVALLHSFWYERASEAFKDAVAADSTCAMGYWGQAMSLFHPLWTPPSSDELRAGLGAAVRGYAVASRHSFADFTQSLFSPSNSVSAGTKRFSTSAGARAAASFAIFSSSIVKCV